MHVWTMAALSLALVAALAFGGRAANAAGGQMHIDERVKPKIVLVGQKQTFHIHVKNESRKNATNQRTPSTPISACLRSLVLDRGYAGIRKHPSSTRFVA
jgi:hypothetical protein